MHRSILPRRSAVGTLALAALLASTAGAQADISVTDASITGGKLVVSGAASSGAQIRLDGQEGAAFNAKAGVDGSFSFSLVYHPGDCVIAVETLVPPYRRAGESAEGLVANCGPAGVTPRGAWARATAYAVNDLVTHDGSTWRAKRNNAGRTPSAGADWDLFAAAGESASEAAAGGSLRVPPTGPAGGDLQGNYPNPQIRNLVIVASNLVDNAITNPKINNSAVNSLKVADNTLTADDLASSSVTSSEIASNAVSASEIADGSIDSGEIVNDSLTAADLAPDSVGASEIASSAVGSSEIATDAVTATEIADNSIDSGEILNNSLTLSDISGAHVNGTISIGAGAVADGECEDFSGGVPGAAVGDGVVISLRGALPEGILIYGVRVAVADNVIFKVCNLSGGAMAAIVNLPIKTFTFN